MEARPYQLKTVEQIQIHKANLIIAPQRSGKSYIMKLAIEQHKFQKVLIIVGFRKIVTQLANYFPNDHTFILAGKEYDSNKQVHLASFQTFANRAIALEQYDCIIIDEFHSRASKAVYTLVNQPLCTKLLFTGTPLTNTNRLITKGIDHYIQPTSVKELLDNKWLAPTQFMSNSNILGERAAELQTNKTDFDQAVVRQIIKKEDLLQNVLNLITKHKIDTQHKAAIYVNFIKTADELYTLLKDRTNVFLIHSKLTQAEQEAALTQYEQAESAILINVRALSLGWDSPTTDTIIYAMFTKIHSLALQIMWRASTINNQNPHKVATVYDLVGQLASVNPYTDFKSYSKKKTCKEICDEQYANSPREHYFCTEACTGEPVLIKCNGELAYTHQTNPFISNFQVTEGTPCQLSRPSWEFKFKQTDNGIGSITKWSKCSCGTVTSYDVQTLIKPSQMIPVYNDLVSRNTVTIIYSQLHSKALALFDNISKPRYKILMFNSSEELYIQACTFFRGEQFQIISNRALPKLPNVAVNKELDVAIDLISWETQNLGFTRKLIRMKFEHMVKFFNLRAGMVFYVMQAVTPDNEKSVLTHLSTTTFERTDFIRYCTKLQNTKEQK